MRTLAVISLLFLCGCMSHKLPLGGKVREVDLQDSSPEDIKIPVKIWSAIEKYSKPQDDLAPQPTDEDERFTNKNPVLFSPITVVLTENNPDVLDTSEIRIKLP